MDTAFKKENIALKQQNERIKKLNQSLISQVNSLKTELINLKNSYSELHHAFIDLNEFDPSNKQCSRFIDLYDEVMKISDCQMISFANLTPHEISTSSFDAGKSQTVQNASNLLINNSSKPQKVMNESQTSFSINQSQLLKNINQSSPNVFIKTVMMQKDSENRNDQSEKIITEKQVQQNQSFEGSSEMSFNELVALREKQVQTSEALLSGQFQFSRTQDTQNLMYQQLQARMNPEELKKMKQQLKLLYPHLNPDESINLEHQIQQINSTVSIQSKFQDFTKQQVTQSFQSKHASSLQQKVTQSQQSKITKFLQFLLEEQQQTSESTSADLGDELLNWVKQSQRILLKQQKQKIISQYKVWKKIQNFKFIQQIEVQGQKRFIINFPAFQIMDFQGSETKEQFIIQLKQFVQAFSMIKVVQFHQLILDEKLNCLTPQLSLQFLALSWTTIKKLTIINSNGLKKINFGKLFSSLHQSLEEIDITISFLNEQTLQEIINAQFSRLHRRNIKFLRLTQKAYDILQQSNLLNLNLMISQIKGNQLVEIGHYQINTQIFVMNQNIDSNDLIYGEETMFLKKNFVQKYHQSVFYKIDAKTKWTRIQMMQLCNNQLLRQFLQLNWGEVRNLYLGDNKLDKSMWQKIEERASLFPDLQMLTLRLQTMEFLSGAKMCGAFPSLKEINIVYVEDQKIDDKRLNDLLYLGMEFKRVNEQIEVEVYQWRLDKKEEEGQTK